MASPSIKGGDFVHNNTNALSEKRILPLFSNKSKTAIVSGAGAGIGLAVAQALAESGANVAIWYNRNKKALQRAEDIEKEYGVKCMYPLVSKLGILANIVAIIRQSIPGQCHRPKARRRFNYRHRQRIQWSSRHFHRQCWYPMGTGCHA